MNILLTGAASGIGRATADRFLKEGHTVYALDIQPMEQEERFIPYRADITDTGALDEIAHTLCSSGVTLDIIVHTAGMHAMASLVECDAQLLSRVMQVNALGAMQLVRAMHSTLAERGRILLVTSEVATLDPMPFNGLYSVSKHALDCYAQALRQELGLLGQTVITVRPGAVETPLCRGSLAATEHLAETTQLYREQATHFLSLTRAFMGKPMKPEALASLIYRSATARRPRLTYHKHRNLGLLLLNLLPLRLQCAIIRLLLGRRSKNSADA